MIFFQKMMASDDGIYCRFVRIGAVFRHKKRSEAQSVRRQTFLSIGYTASFCKSTLPSRRFSLPLCKSSNHFCKPTLPLRRFLLGYPTSSRIDKSFLFRDFKGISGFKKEPYSISNFFNLIFARVRALSITFGGNPSLFWIS